MSKTKTKKKLRTMRVEVEKTPPPTTVETVKASLESLEASTGWGIVRKILDENIAFLEQCILTKIDPTTKQEITDKEAENCRYKRSLNIELRDTPANYRKQLTETGFVPKNFDPYFMTKAEIETAEKAG